jgi:glucose-1-phosphate thymidylyltransferase
MKNIVIAAGYATRLYPLTENFPKPLLEIGSSSILGRMMEDIDRIEDIDEHIIVSNHKFARHFEEWAEKQDTRCPVTIIDDGTETNETRLGAVKDLLLAIDHIEKTNSHSQAPQRSSSSLSSPSSTSKVPDLLVVAADNILDFSFQGFVDFFKEKGTSVIMCHHEPELKKLQRTGVIKVDENMKVLLMQEKPEEPVSNWAVPPFYIYSRNDIPLIKDCMNHGCGFDAPGNLAHYLTEVTTLHAWQMPGKRFDIGTLDTYYEAKEIFK